MLTPGPMDAQGFYGCIERDQALSGVRRGDRIELEGGGAATVIGVEPMKGRATVRECDGTISTVKL